MILLFGFLINISTWWRLFQKRVVRTKLDIYVFISNEVFGIMDEEITIKMKK
jgi:hypothetical protein